MRRNTLYRTHEWMPNGLLLSVKDQLGKVLESHTYDSVRRGLTSQRANGVDSLTVNYFDGTSVDGKPARPTP